jgi:hypothetical protein
VCELATADSPVARSFRPRQAAHAINYAKASLIKKASVGKPKSTKSIKSAPFSIFQLFLPVPNGFYTFATHFINKLINHEQLRDSIHSQSRFV